MKDQKTNIIIEPRLHGSQYVKKLNQFQWFEVAWKLSMTTNVDSIPFWAQTKLNDLGKVCRISTLDIDFWRQVIWAGDKL